MEFILDHPFLRSEFDWLAVDGQGRLGFFATAGAGPLPDVVAANAAAFETLYEDVLALPAICEAVIVAETTRNISEWIEVGRRGLFAFDWRRETNCYELIVQPAEPLITSDRDRLTSLSLRMFVRIEADFAKLSALSIPLRQ